MDMTGEQRLATHQQAVWDALNDPEVLKHCIPGCESIEQTSPTEHHVSMMAAVGPVKARFKGKMFLEDPNPPHAYKIRFEGQGGVAGFAKGLAEVSLLPDGEHTLMRYQVHAQVGGKLAQVGSRLIDAAARKVADEFFAAFNARVAPVATATDATTPVPQSRKAGMPAWVWGAAALLAVAAYFFLMRPAGTP